MSRCFPYPPPVHDALIESIKLQKEMVEKSDLTEEHGQPISPNSSDSTQNSNKRKGDDYSLLRDSSTGHGSFKIRLMKKQKGSDSNNYVVDVSSNISDTNRLHFGRVQPASSFAKPIIQCNRPQVLPRTYSEQHVTPTPSVSRNVEQRVRQQQVPTPKHHGMSNPASSFVKPILQCNRPQVLPRTYSEQHGIPTPSVSRNVEQRVRQQQVPTPNNHGMSNPLSNKTITTSAGGRATNGISVAVNDGLTKQKEEPQKARLTRSEKKMLKKHAKYEKLIGSWLQPVFQAHIPTDDDWLCSSKTTNSSISKREGETCREMVVSLQPCARFLAEVDVHALPYTVPF